jgi:hypothetical protein
MVVSSNQRGTTCGLKPLDQYARRGLRYSSDVTDAEWLVISPHLPRRKRFGRPPKTALRSIVDALLYMARTGCQ